MTNEKDYSYRSATKSYYDPDTTDRELTKSKWGLLSAPTSFYTDYTSSIDLTDRPNKGGIPAIISTSPILGVSRTAPEPVKLFFKTSKVSVPPPGLGVSLREYQRNIKNKLHGLQYLISPVILVQNQTDSVLSKFTQLEPPNGIAPRTIFGRPLRVIGIDKIGTSTTYNQRFLNQNKIVESGQYRTFVESFDLGKINHEHVVKQTTSTQAPEAGRYNQLTGTTTGSYMGYWQTDVEFLDLRPKEQLTYHGGVIGWYDDKRLDGTSIDNVQLVQDSRAIWAKNSLGNIKRIKTNQTLVDSWTTEPDYLLGSVEHYFMQDNRYWNVSLTKMIADRRQFHLSLTHRADDIYACAYSFETNDSIVVVEVDDEDVDCWLSLPEYDASQVTDIIQNRARYQHYSLFHIKGSNNKIIVKFNTTKLNPKMIPYFHDRLTVSLFSFAPNTEGNSIVMAFIQESLEKRKRCAENYFDRNLPAGGITETVKERYSLMRTYKGTGEGLLVESIRFQTRLPEGDPMRAQRYFNMDDAYNIYHAYPCYSRLSYSRSGGFFPEIINRNNTGVRVGLVMPNSGITTYTSSDGIIDQSFMWYVPENRKQTYTNLASNLDTAFQNDANHPVIGYNNQVTNRLMNDKTLVDPYVKYRYHLTYPDPAIDGVDVSPSQLGSCFNYAATVMHVIASGHVNDTVERIIVIEGRPDGKPVDLHFKSAYLAITPFCVSGSHLNITFVIKCKLNLIVDLYDNETKNEPINYCFLCVNGTNNKVKVIYEEGCFIRFVHKNPKQHFRLRVLKFGHSSIMRDQDADTNEVRFYKRFGDLKVMNEGYFVCLEGKRDRPLTSWTPATDADLNRATHYKMRPYRDEDITRTGNVLHVGGGDQYIGFVSRNGG